VLDETKENFICVNKSKIKVFKNRLLNIMKKKLKSSIFSNQFLKASMTIMQLCIKMSSTFVRLVLICLKIRMSQISLKKYKTFVQADIISATALSFRDVFVKLSTQKNMQRHAVRPLNYLVNHQT